MYIYLYVFSTRLAARLANIRPDTEQIEIEIYLKLSRLTVDVADFTGPGHDGIEVVCQQKQKKSNDRKDPWLLNSFQFHLAQYGIP